MQQNIAYDKILVINLMHIGDLLLVTPVLRTLRANYPQAHIALVADAKLADLVKYNKNIDELIALDKKGYHNKLGHYLQAVADIRRKNFELVINLHANERASFIAAFSGSNKIVGYATFGLRWLFTHSIKNRKAIKHQVESHFDVLRELAGIDHVIDYGIEMWLDDEAESKASELWTQTFGKTKASQVIGLNIGASWPTKRWPSEYYAELADHLLELGYGIAFFGGAMDQELVAATISLMQHNKHTNLKVFTGQLSLLVLAAMLKKCVLLVTNDSGPMHIAVAMDVPLVTMFGSSPVPGFYPYNNTSILLQSPLDCHPCGKHQCLERQHECMKVITPQIILKYTLELLQKTIDKPRKRSKDAYKCEVIKLKEHILKENQATLTILILAKNEEKNIRACIATAQFADEIVLIDDFSTDNTKAIAEEMGAKVWQRALNGDWGSQQTFAIEQATSEWIFILDADERITPSLAAEIKMVLGNNDKIAYKVSRLNHLMERRLRYGGWYPDFGIHLLPRAGVYVEGYVHQKICHNYPIKHLQNHLIHYPYTSWEQYFNKLNLYTKLAAEKNRKNGKHANFFFDIMLRPYFAFFKMYILKSGWRDGKVGFILAAFHFFYTMAKYVKLYYLQQENNKLQK